MTHTSPSPRTTVLRLHALLPNLALGAALTLGGCSSPSSDPSDPVAGAPGIGGSANAGAAGSPAGGMATGGQFGLAGASSGGRSGAPSTGGGPGSAGAALGGSTSSGGSAAMAAGTSNGGSGLAGGGNGGSGVAGSAGSPAAGATSGGGSSGGTNAGAAGTSTSGGAAGSGTAGAGGGGTGSAEPDIECPANATFCSGFEGTAFPAPARFHTVGPSAEGGYAFDTAQKFAGNKSLSIPMHTGGFYYRALTVPVPSGAFWVRLYVRVSRAFGDGGHDSLFGASTGTLEQDVNNEALVEFSEQFDEVLLNTDDQLFNPEGANTLAADKWHCMEASYDPASGDVKVYADGKELINAPGYAKREFKTFRLGYMQYHDTRAVWYDDVIVAPTRVNCK